VFLPFERVGQSWFGGDWYGGQQGSDRSLWVLLADVTGHGYYAYLLASVLPQVWQSCWTRANRPDCQPTDLLNELHHLLEDCLPEGVFVEATLVRLGADGALVVAPAGGTRLFLNRLGTEEVNLIKLRGGWIGFLPANPADQYTTSLGHGDELVLATDGLFDQLAMLAEPTLQVLRPGEGSLLDQVQQQLVEALRAHEQKDDITLVALRRLLPDDSRPGD
jgi:serine phosphatase RsbU (regulator of sigma subunit)